MPYCRDCGDYISGRDTYCYDCERDIIDRSRSSISRADSDERRRINNDKNYAHDWLQDVIGWIVSLWGIITKIYSGGGCYITSAVVKHKGLSDNCYEMTRFRSFREEYILKSNNPNLLNELQEYYLQSIFLINWINSRADSDLIWEYVSKYVFKFLNYIEDNEFVVAYSYFKACTLNLKNDILRAKHIS